MRSGLLLLSGLAFVMRADAQTTPTWAEDIAPIFYNNCTKCHNTNGIANMYPLITYSEAVSIAPMIQYNVTNGIMPPWPPDTTYKRLAHERILSPAEVAAIDAWVNGGTPSGNLSNAPTPPVYNTGATMTNPTVDLTMPVYTVNTTTDLYRCFVIPSGVGTTQYIKEIEIIPGNRQIVHHVLAYQDTSQTPVNLDNNDPGPGYTSFGGVGSNTAELIGGWVPGDAGIARYPVGMGVKFLANSYIILQIHYPGGITNQVDSTRILLKLQGGSMREVYLDPILNHVTNITPALIIPANQVKSFSEQYFVPINVSLISIAPHMHLIGQKIKSYAVDPNGDTIPLINIPKWDFHWQGFYNFRKVTKIPMNSWLKAEATYDNTVNNPNNPNNPPQTVVAGESTTDEMMIVYFAWTYYLPGDENIILDSSAVLGVENNPDMIVTPQLYAPYPSPANDEVTVDFYLPEKSTVSIELYDMTGKLVASPIEEKEFASGSNTCMVNIKNLSSGIYLVKLRTGDTVRTKKVVKE
ncbi:MAG: T9SS type A sorting domain-containing protein [Bacteroidota bacterium]